MTASHGAELELVAVSKTFGAVLAVDDVSLTVASGEFLTLLGPSGSGKTTTLMMIAGFESATAGGILLGGRLPPPHARGDAGRGRPPRGGSAGPRATPGLRGPLPGAAERRPAAARGPR